MKRVEIQIPDFIGGKLIKDLQEDEAICEDCKGTGLRIEDNVYGLGEKGKAPFPYKHQSISFCQHCYNGVVNLCPHCGKILGQRTQCDCTGYMKAKYEEETIKEKECFEKAKKITYEEYIKQYPNYMIFDPNTDEFYSELEDLEDHYASNGLELPKYVYGTNSHSICLDIDNLIENACDDLYEDAYDRIEGYEDLQAAMYKFSKQNEQNTMTFDPDCSLAILL